MKYLLPLLIILTSCSPKSREIASISGCADIVVKLLGPKRLESSIEIETTFSNGMLAYLLDTTDGTIAPLFKGMEPPANIDLSASWRTQNLGEKMRILNEIASRRGKSFDEARTIEGLIIRKSIEIDFKETTQLFGKNYPTGRHQVEIGHLFRDVQYGAPEDLQKLRVLELHLRAPMSGAELVQNSRKLVDLIKLDVPNFHLHTVAEIPYELLRNKPKAGAMAIADLHRRADLASQVLDIITIQNTIAPYIRDGVTFQGTTTPQTVTGVAQYFFSLAQGSDKKLLDEFKLSWVGLHGRGKYDDPELWGMQFRQLLEDHSSENLSKIIGGVESRMREGLAREIDKMASWSTSHSFDDLAALNYNQSWKKLTDVAPPPVKRLTDNDLILEVLEDASSQNEALKMLVFDWSKDPLFKGSSQELYRYQAAAIEKIMNVEKVSYRNYDYEVGIILSDFLKESGLGKQIFESVGANGIL